VEKKKGIGLKYNGEAVRGGRGECSSNSPVLADWLVKRVKRASGCLGHVAGMGVGAVGELTGQSE
jgi:hypothetical protein